MGANPNRTILEMTSEEARAFLLRQESYCNVDLPWYFDFSGVLAGTAQILGQTSLSDASQTSPRGEAGVNYTLLTNKDGRHAWRPFQIIHPAIYVTLVKTLTERAAWDEVRRRFQSFSASPQIDCLSVPVESQTKRSDQAEQVLNWWHGIEQRSVELSMDYQFVLHADIADCYSSIYTHSIPWAIHTRPVAKAERNNKTLLGNVLDRLIQDMREGQTNGISQGSVLMDFIAEIVLGSADELLADRLSGLGGADYHILRYRDDYRVFVNNPELGEQILRSLSEVLIELGLKLNTSKTSQADLVVPSSLKADKWAWILSRQRDANIQKHLLGIHAHGMAYRNGGSLMVAMSEFYKRLLEIESVTEPLAVIAIALDIAYHSPRVFPACAATISALLPRLEPSDRLDVLGKILRRVRGLSNVGHMEVWLQRISHPIHAELEFDEQLCAVVRSSSADALWKSDWISSTDLRAALTTDIVDRVGLAELSTVVRHDEIDLFAYDF